MNERQKALNNAFYATLFMTVISLSVVIFGYAKLNTLAICEMALFIIFGFLTMKSKKFASLGLLILFVLDRILWVINWGTNLNTTNPSQLLFPVIYTYTIWIIFYKAYLFTKKPYLETIPEDHTPSTTNVAYFLGLKNIKLEKTVKWIIILIAGYLLLFYLGGLLYKTMFK